MITGLRLIDGDNELDLYPGIDGIEPQNLTLGSPDSREVASVRTDADGSQDTTKHFGSRAVSLSLMLYEDPAQIAVLLDEIAAYLHPASRPYLYVTDDGWAQERRILLRTDQWSAPYTGYASSLQRAVQLQWKAPDGVWEDTTQVTTVVPVDAPSTAGLPMPAVMPATFNAGTGAGARIFTNTGTVPLQWSARLYGPCTAPRLANETTGEAIVFKTSMVLNAGDYLDIDSRARTVLLLGDSSNSRLADVDYSQSTWWTLAVGDNQIRYNPATLPSAGAYAEFYTRTQWL